MDHDAIAVVVAVFIPRANKEDNQPQDGEAHDPDAPAPIAQMNMRGK